MLLCVPMDVHVYVLYIERPSYMQMRLERENFRKKLVELIARKDDDDDGSAVSVNDLDAEFPNKEEKEVLRYYYYIKHGIDTIHVSPMSKKVLNRWVYGCLDDF